MEIAKENPSVVVSICVITYRQEKIIGKVLDYLLAQKTTFTYEIVLGEDFSPDGTRKVCLEYQSRNPERIKLVLNQRNLGMIGNFVSTMKHCTGKYIAICAGDDFWVSPNKLQIQVDFLERNRDFSMVSCEAYYTNVNFKNNLTGFGAIILNNYKLNGLFTAIKILSLYFYRSSEFWCKRRLPYSKVRRETGGLVTVLNDLEESRYYPASACLYRREVISNVPVEAFKYKAEHISFILWSALAGKIKLLKEPMIVKNGLVTSVTVSKEIQDTYNPKEAVKNYVSLLSLALPFAKNREDREKLDSKIIRMSKNI